MWVDPETKEPIQGVCPFLIELSPGLYSCRIYEFRPRVCRTYVPGQNCLNGKKSAPLMSKSSFFDVSVKTKSAPTLGATSSHLAHAATEIGPAIFNDSEFS